MNGTERKQALSTLRTGHRVAYHVSQDDHVRQIEAALAEGLDVKLLVHDGFAAEVIPCSPAERGSVSRWGV
jgi:hypothetical protein